MYIYIYIYKRRTTETLNRASYVREMHSSQLFNSSIYIYIHICMYVCSCVNCVYVHVYGYGYVHVDTLMSVGPIEKLSAVLQYVL